MGLRNWLGKRRERKLQKKLDEASKVVFNALMGKDAQQLATEGGWELLGRVLSTNSDSPWKTYSTSAAEKFYTYLSVIYACAKKIADTMGTITYTVAEYDNADERTEYPQHPMLKLIEHPNDKMSYAEFIFNVVLHLELTGISYIFKARNQAGMPDGLWPFPSSWITEELDRAGRLRFYKIERDGFTQRVRPEDMIIIIYPDAANPMSPAGPTQACFRDAQLDEARADYMIDMLENMHLPGPVITQEEPWEEDQLRMIRRIVRDKIGKGKRGSPLFAGGNGVKIEMVDPLADIDWAGTAGLNETRICSTFEVPPILLHLRAGLDRATYSNYEQAKKAFYQGKVMTVAKKLGDSFSLGLLQVEGDVDFWFEPVTDDIPELQEDETARAERVIKVWTSGGLTLDQYLAELGYEEIGGRDGEMRLLPMGVQPWYPNEEIEINMETDAGTDEEEDEGFGVTDEDDEDEEDEEDSEENIEDESVEEGADAGSDEATEE